MTVTVQVNNLTLSHKGSGGWVKCTLPDVCKTPPGPVPVPYPAIFSFSKDLQNGTTTVSADGGNSCSIAGSQYAVAYGDEPGTAGGVKSGVNMKEATWLSYSFDVKMEGQGACRLTDKMLMNRGNTASLAGDVELPLTPWEEFLLCEAFCSCLAVGRASKMEVPLPDLTVIEDPDFDQNPSPQRFGYQKCVESELKGNPLLVPEQSYNMRVTPPAPVGEPGSMIPGTRRPDVVVLGSPGPASGLNLSAVVEMKFPGDSYRPGQRRAYQRIAQENNPAASLVELDEERCCKQRQRVPVTAPARERAKVSQPATQSHSLVPWAIGWGALVLLTAAAVVLTEGAATPLLLAELGV